MFELCKKIEVYNIENNYYYYRTNPIESQLSTKLGLHLLKTSPIKSINNGKLSTTRKSKKGLQLSKTIDCIPSSKDTSDKISSPYRIKLLKQKQKQQSNQLSLFYKNNISRLRTATQQNQHLLSSLYNNFTYSPKIYHWDHKGYEGNTSRIQTITTKTKPNVYIDSQNKFAHQPVIKKQGQSQQQINRNLFDTIKPPVSSKIQTCYTNGLPSSQHLISKYEPEIALTLHENLQNQQSKLISISKSVSSVHETLNQKEHRRYDLSNDEISKSGHEFSISLSNIFSRQQSAGFDCRKSMKQNSMKKLSLFLDSERHTIQSRFSRELNLQEEQQPKIQQSFIYTHDPKEKFQIFESDQIKKKQYLMSKALQKNINLIVSLKQVFSSQLKSIVQELQIYELIQKNLMNKPEFHDILELYQVQMNEGSYLFIKQPYLMSLQAKLKQSTFQESIKLRQIAKNIASKMIQFLQKFGIYASRKITTHQFVICLDGPKIHDLSIFNNQANCLLTKEQIIAGIDI